MDLNEVMVFIRVIQAGSFSGAARQLGMPNSTVSHRVSSLESRLGVTLLRRTTRKLQVTPAGQAFYQSCLEGLEKIWEAKAEISSSQREPQGLLRITAPVEFGNRILAQLVFGFTQKYPKVQIEMLLSDRRVDLLAENVDLAIRAGDLEDSTLIAKRLGDVTFALMGAPALMKKVGTLSHPRELSRWPCLQFTPLGTQHWTLYHHQKMSFRVPLPGKILVNDLNMVKALTLSGAGLALLPTFFCQSEVQERQLIQILPQWTTRRNPIHFVYPAQKFVPPKLSAFISATEEGIKKSLS